MINKNKTKIFLEHFERSVWIAVALFFGSFQVVAQELTIRGTVRSGVELLPGVSVYYKANISEGVVTDEQGSYNIKFRGANDTLVFSSIGYQKTEIPIGARSLIDVDLKSDNVVLNEVVVVGYGTQKRENITGSIATVKGEDLVKRQVVNPVASLQGLMPGVQVTQNSGQPGAENMDIVIRGQGTYSSAGSAPLILVNGVPGNLSDLNPNTIESILVLKDEASCAIYGARAANGVILVVTKDGSKNGGKFHVTYNFNLAMNEATRLPKMVTNSVDYMNFFNQAKINSGNTSESQLYPQSVIDLYKNPSDPVRYPNADWVSLMFRTAPTYMHNLSISGGQKTTYDVSLGYVDQFGVMKVLNYKKYNFLLNLSSEVHSRLKIGLNLGLKSGDQSLPRNGAGDAWYQTVAHPPTALPWLPDGSGRYTYKAYTWEEATPNQFAANNQLKQNIDYAINSQAWADLKITKGLNWYTKGAVNGYFGRNKTFSATIPLYNYLDPKNEVLSSNVPGNGLEQSMDQTQYMNIYSYLNYEQTFGEHLAGLQAGFSQEKQDYYILQGSRPNFSAGGVLQELNAGDTSPQYNSGTSNAWALQSFFGRLRYNYAEKYIIESNLRYDGSSRLSKQKRWGLFPSFSFAWRLTEENFMKGVQQGGFINDTKIRLSWGQLGNQNIGNYPYQSLVNLGGNYPFGSTLNSGAYRSALNNENITWETTAISNFGLDLILFKHLNITFEAYQKETTDILRSAQITGVVGLSEPTVNSGAMRNRGLELAINYGNKIKGNLKNEITYNLGFNISGFRNTTTRFGELQDNGSTVIEEGLPWNSFYLLQQDGIFQTADEVSNSAKQFGEDYAPGDLKFKDINNDKVIDNNDRVKMTKGVFPSYSYGFTASLGWGGFDFYCFLQGVQGQKGVFGYGYSAGLTPFFSGVLKDIAEQAWTPENHSNTVPRLYYADYPGQSKIYSRPSTYLLNDMSYWRIKQLQLGYTFPSTVVEKAGLQKIRVYVATDNLATFTNYKGTDPEKPAGPFLAYPQNRIFSFGLSANF